MHWRNWFSPRRFESLRANASRRRLPAIEALETRTLLASTPLTFDTTVPSSSSDSGDSDVAMAENGRFVVVWEQDDGGTGTDIRAQRYNADRTKFGNEIVVASAAFQHYSNPRVAMNGSGTVFVIVYEYNTPSTRSASGDQDIWQKRYAWSTSGSATASSRVNTTDDDYDQRNPEISMADDGRYVIVFDHDHTDKASDGIRYRAYGSTGTAYSSTDLTILGGQTSYEFEADPSVSMRSDGEVFVATWEELDGDYEIGHARYSWNGSGFQYAGLKTESFTGVDYTDPVVEMASDGTYVLAWESDYGSSDHITFARYSASGSVITSPVVISGLEGVKTGAYSGNGSFRPDIAMSADDSFIIAWRGEYPDLDRASGRDVFYREYSSSGTNITGGSNRYSTKWDYLSTLTSGVHEDPAVAKSNTRFMATFTDDDRVRFRAFMTEDRLEPNDSRGSATSYTIAPATIVQEYIENLTIHDDDRDWFSLDFQGPPYDGSQLAIYVQNSGGNIDANVYRLDGDTLTLIGTLNSVSDREEFLFEQQPQGIYYLEIFGVSGAQNSYLLVLEVKAHMPAPQLTGPVLSTDDMTPTITWEQAAGAAKYELYVRDLTTGQRIVSNADLTSLSYTPSVPWHARQYRVWIRSISTYGAMSDWSEDLRFRIRNSIRITAPTAYRTLDSTPTIEWSDLPDSTWGAPVAHEVWIQRHRTKFNHVQGISTASYTTSALPLGRYFLWARAILANGVEAGWSRVHEMVIVTPPRLIAPTGDTSDVSPLIQWDAVPGAATYELWISDLTTATSPLLQPRDITSTFWRVTSELTRGHSYRVWARAYDERGWRGYYGTPIDFRVVTLEPTDTEILDSLDPTNINPPDEPADVAFEQQVEVADLDLLKPLVVDQQPDVSREPILPPAAVDDLADQTPNGELSDDGNNSQQSDDFETVLAMDTFAADWANTDLAFLPDPAPEHAAAPPPATRPQKTAARAASSSSSHSPGRQLTRGST